MERKKVIMIILTTLIVIVLFSPLFLFPEILGFIIKEQKNQVQFYFHDQNECLLDGYVFVGDRLVGKAERGYFNLAYYNYIENFNVGENLSLFGTLGGCFSEDLFFDKYWKIPAIEKYYFEGESVFEFGAEINAHNPTKRELMGFVQAGEVSSELEEIETSGVVLTDLSSINQHLNEKINYVKDWDFNKENYWQTPLETLTLEQGDCEDYSSTLLSLFLAYDNSLNCYNIIFSSHVTTFCKIGNYYAYFDQEKTELKKEITNRNELKNELMKLKNDYFEHYGIENERAHYAFNDNTFVEFNEGEELIDWQYTLGEKEREKVFDRLEREVREVQKIYPIESLELAANQTSELPTLSGFFKDNFIMLIALASVFIILIVVLIIVGRFEDF
jgi:hypothetical protein